MKMKIGEEKIAEAAYKLFKQRGVRLTTMQHVARACKTSLFDINQTFASKKQLVLAVIKFTLDKKTTYLSINSSISPSAVMELNNFFKFIEDSIADLGIDIFSEVRRYNPQSLDQLQELVDQKLTPYLQRNIERGLSEGFYRNNLDSDRFTSTYFYFLRTILESDREWNEMIMAMTHINDIFLHGVLSIKGMYTTGIFDQKSR